MTDSPPDPAIQELVDLARELVERFAAGAADVTVQQVSADLWSVEVTPHRRSAAPIGLVPFGGDEVSATVGPAPFYSDWGDSAATAHLREVLLMTILGRVEARGWLGDPALRVRPLQGKPYVFGAFSLVPWPLRRRRSFDPYDEAVTDHGESLRSCSDCGHLWSEHPGGGDVPADGVCGECGYEIQHGFAPPGYVPCRRQTPMPL